MGYHLSLYPTPIPLYTLIQMARKLLFALLCFAPLILAQNPDCQFSATFTAVGFGNQPANGWQNISNSTAPACVAWRVVYAVTGFSAVSLQFEGAANVSGVPGSYSAAPSTVISEGTNPLTDASCAPGGSGCTNVVRAYYPWVQLHVTSVTGSGSGTILAKAYGYRGTNVGWSQSPGGSASPTGVNLVQVNGATVDTNGNGDQGVINSCTTFAAFNLSGSGNTQIVAASSTKKIIVCSLIFATGTPEDVKFTEGTGSNCAGGTADASGLYKSISAYAHDALGLPYTATASDALCINQSVAQALGGTVWYRYQ